MPITALTLSELSPISHGFFTREGGVSEGIYASLNCGNGSRDDPDAVRENQQRVVHQLAGKAVPLCKLYQVHSAEVITVTTPWLPEAAPKADAMVTRMPHQVLAILTADCGPVLFADAQAGVIGAAHAGWKGALGGVLENTLSAMEALGARMSRTVAVLGPCIAQRSYEVGAEFYQRFAETNALYGTFFVPSPEHTHHYLFDLGGFIAHRLALCGLQNVGVIAMDTYANEQHCFSYRRTTHRGEPDYGRQVSAIMLREG